MLLDGLARKSPRSTTVRFIGLLEVRYDKLLEDYARILPPPAQRVKPTPFPLS